jgi:hypothetical protein
MCQPYIGQTRNRVSAAGMPAANHAPLIRARRGAPPAFVEHDSGSRGLRQTRAAAGLRAPAGARRVNGPESRGRSRTRTHSHSVQIPAGRALSAFYVPYPAIS